MLPVRDHVLGNSMPAAQDPAPVPAEDRPYAMALCALPGIGPVRSRLLRDAAGSFREAWYAGPGGLARLGVPGFSISGELEAAWRSISPSALSGSLCGLGISAVFAGDAGYPADLLHIRGAPLVVYIRGEIREVDRPAVALVGTRRMSAYGQWMASRLALGLAQQGLTVVSGLARGIDSAAHRSALSAGGRTVAVLPGGLDMVYPPEHVDLAAEIAGRGALVSEYPPGTPVLPGNFPARNRLIAGMSAATVVVEAGIRSGALITANLALEAGREVLAVPGRVGAFGSTGVHALLKEGAGLVESAADIVAVMPPWQTRGRVPGDDRLLLSTEVQPGGQPPGGRDLPPDRGQISGSAQLPVRILGLLAAGPRSDKEIIESTGASAEEVRAALVILEMEGRLARLPGAVYASRAAGRR